MVRRCTVLHQFVPPDAPPDEAEVLEAATAVARGLRTAGWEARLCPMNADLAATDSELRAQQPDLVFNLVESVDGADVLCVAAPALLERMGLRYSGNDLPALALTADKRATRAALRRAGLAVPPGPEEGGAGPFIVKHATRHASAGLSPDSVVEQISTLPAGCYAEAFIDGREFNISILAGTVLPAAELLFLDWPADTPRLDHYASKWQPEHPHYRCLQRSFTVEPDLARSVQGTALAVWHALGLAGYARVDLRLAPDGRLYVIDVNTNPSIAEGAGFAAAAAQAGLDHAAMVARIAEAALDPPSLTLRTDLAGDDDIGALCRATGFFTAAEVAVAEELAADRRARGPSSDYNFRLADDAAGLVGYACYGPIAGTAESWDLYWIVVHPRAQGRGVGRRLIAAVVDDMRATGGRRLYAETAGKPQYAATRGFYAAAGFSLQAVVPDFYAPGDDKQIWLRTAA